MKNLLQTCSLFFAFLLLVSCGKNSGENFVKNIKVNTIVENQQVKLQISTEIDFGNVILPSLSYPVYSRSNRLIGSVMLVPKTGSLTELVIELNTSDVGDLNLGQVVLPNGNLVPLIGTNPALAIDLGSKGKLYLARSGDKFAFGVALTLSGLDSLGRSLNGLSFFPMFNVNNNVGAAGLFLSTEAGKSGLGFFVDLSGKLPIPSSSQARTLMAYDADAYREEIVLDYSEHRPDSRRERQLKWMLYQMSQQKRRIRQ
jgi:hypothetical protein